MMRIMQDLSYEEIAENLELPLQTVKNRIFKARQMLRAKRKAEHDL
jgi:DNA-directed RNA polymerase specialized sigma24 family protein